VQRALRRALGPLQAAAPEGPNQSAAQAAGKLEPQPSQCQRQVMLVEIQDRFGCLFLDFKGVPRACFMFGALKQVALALRGVVLGVFIGERCPDHQSAESKPDIRHRCAADLHTAAAAN
jgi:hypothetical protein